MKEWNYIIDIGISAVAFCIGFSLVYFYYSCFTTQIEIDESQVDGVLYPFFMKSPIIMGVNTGLFIMSSTLSCIHVVVHKFQEENFGVKLAFVGFISFAILFVIAQINTSFLYSELNLIIVFLILPCIMFLLLLVNFCYMIFSFSSRITLKKYFILPNIICSIGLYSLFIILWHWILILHNLRI